LVEKKADQSVVDSVAWLVEKKVVYWAELLVVRSVESSAETMVA
jgi:predicted metalloprotease with PDZ domain